MAENIIPKTVEYSFNCNTPDSNVKYYAHETTDYYRKGNPYKLLRNSGSYIRFKFYNPANENGNSLIGAKFKVNHCGTTSDGKVDIRINGDELHHGYAPPRYNFGWEEFCLPIEKLHHGVNEIKVTLNDHSFGVYWYSDATIILETGK